MQDQHPRLDGCRIIAAQWQICDGLLTNEFNLIRMKALSVDQVVGQSAN
jgi:hypothetical protein